MLRIKKVSFLSKFLFFILTSSWQDVCCYSTIVYRNWIKAKKQIQVNTRACFLFLPKDEANSDQFVFYFEKRKGGIKKSWKNKKTNTKSWYGYLPTCRIFRSFFKHNVIEQTVSAVSHTEAFRCENRNVFCRCPP